VASKYDLVNYTMISCRQLSSKDFVLQSAGKYTSASCEFQNFLGIMPWTPLVCNFSAHLSYHGANLLKNLLKPLNFAGIVLISTTKLSASL